MAKEGSQIPDINFGIGTYDYWRSALMRLLWWMPGVPDKRAEGIEKLRHSMRNGLYTRSASAMVLMDIYLNEELYDQALTLANEMVRKYPRAIVFQWGRARALQGLKRHDEAITVYRQVLTRVEADPNTNHYNAIQCRIGMARNMAALGRNQEVIEQFTAINNYTLTKDIRKRLDSVFTEANTLRRRAERSSD
jgi:tetratricopeptide (TPR) repeat protein